MSLGRTPVCQCLAMAIDADLDVTCPRCGQSVTARFYGPCPACRDELRSTLGSEGRLLEAVDYEPKMNVTPNAVALKD
jgi:hypothetical protein